MTYHAGYRAGAAFAVHPVSAMGAKFHKADMIKKLTRWLIFGFRFVNDKFRVQICKR